MSRFFLEGGMFMWPILFIAIINLVLLIRVGLRLSRGRPGGDPGTPHIINAILFWGALAAVLGFLGQHVGLYKAMSVIARAKAIAPSLVAMGFAESLTTTIFGMTVLVFSALAWFFLHAWNRRRLGRAGAVSVLLLLAGVLTASGVNAAPALTEGGWLGRGGPEQFVFQITAGEDGSLRAVVHTLRDGHRTRELPITTVTYDPPELDLFMAETGVHYRGTVDLEAGRITGGVVPPRGSLSPMNLAWVDPETLPGFLARPRPAAGEPVYTYAVPLALDDGWPTAAPEDVGLDRAAVEAMMTAVIGGEGGVLHSVLLIRHDKLVAEEYFHGYTRDDLHGLLSCTKSVASLLVGIAHDRGELPDLDVPVFDFFPGLQDLRTPEWEAVRLRHLLTMSMGLDWSDKETETVHGTGPDFFRRVLSRRITGTPGAQWRYANADVNLLAGILKEATGLHADVLARDRLFAPLGITAFDWNAMAVDGYRSMDGTLRMRPRDMAKLGALVLDGGRWQDRQVVSEEWMRESTRAQIPTGSGPEDYGYLWWRAKLPAGGTQQTVIFASGLGSQFISVFPDLDLIMVTTGGNQDNGKHFAPGRLLSRYLLPGIS